MDPKLKFWFVSFRLGLCWTISLLHKTWCKTRQTGAINAKARATKSCRNFSQRTHQIHTIWVHLEPFRYCTKLAAKHAKLVQLMQKLVPRSRVGIVRNEHSRSTLLEPKHMFWCVSFRLGAFATISLLHKTWCKTCQTGAINVKVRATKSCHNLSQRTLMILTVGP